jgi:hypothetical protein
MGEPILSPLAAKLGEPFVLDAGRAAVCSEVIERGEPRPRRGCVRMPARAGSNNNRAARRDGVGRSKRVGPHDFEDALSQNIWPCIASARPAVVRDE